MTDTQTSHVPLFSSGAEMGSRPNPSRRIPLTCSACEMREESMWGELTRSEAALVDQTLQRRAYRRGETIFHQDDEPLGIYCVRSGYVLLWRIDAFGNETGFGLVAPGENMGYRSLFAEERHAATARALTPCQVCLMPGAIVNQLLEAKPALARRFLHMVARDRGPTYALLLRGQHVPLRVRLIHLLLVLKERFARTGKDGQLVIELPLSRQDIAAMVGARPETITRAIRELDEEGVATFRGRRVEIKRLDRLLEVAGAEWVD